MRSILTAAVISLASLSTVANAEVLKWAWEDANSDGVWNYSVTNWNFASANEWGNFPVSYDAYEGRTSLAFQYRNEDLNDGSSHTQAFGFALIPTAASNSGTEPTSYGEYETGKDLRAYSQVEFYIKGSWGANQSAFHIWLRSPNGHGSVLVPLRNYVSVNSSWQKVVIPLRDFLPAVSDPNHFQLFNVHAIGFYVNQSDANVPFDFLVDNVSLVNENSGSMPALRNWWKDDANHNGEYNYSTSAMSGGSSLNVANQWGDLVTGYVLTGPMGDTRVPSIDLKFKHNGYGYAEANLTTSRNNTGSEPVDFADRDAGKAIAATNATLNFSAPGIADGVKVKLVDQAGRSSKAISIKDYRSSYGRYAFSYAIPTEAFAGGSFDFSKVKSVTFFVDAGTPAGDYNLSLLSLFFMRK